MTENERNEFYKWAKEQTIPKTNFNLGDAMANSLDNSFDAENQLECAMSTFRMYVDQGVSTLD